MHATCNVRERPAFKDMQIHFRTVLLNTRVKDVRATEGALAFPRDRGKKEGRYLLLVGAVPVDAVSLCSPEAAADAHDQARNPNRIHGGDEEPEVRRGIATREHGRPTKREGKVHGKIPPCAGKRGIKTRPRRTSEQIW